MSDLEGELSGKRNGFSPVGMTHNTDSGQPPPPLVALFATAFQYISPTLRYELTDLKVIHVHSIHVWPLFTIDLDVDKVLVHHLGHELVLETLVREDVTPMTG